MAINLLSRAIVGCCMATMVLSGCSSGDDATGDVVATESPSREWIGTYVEIPDGWCDGLDLSALTNAYVGDIEWNITPIHASVDPYKGCKIYNDSANFMVTASVYPSAEEAHEAAKSHDFGLSSDSYTFKELQGDWEDGTVITDDDTYFMYGRRDNIIVQGGGRCGVEDKSPCVMGDFAFATEEMVDQVLALHTSD